MTHGTGDTMITPTGLIMMTATEAETTTIISRCTLLGMQRKCYACKSVTVAGIFGDGYNFTYATTAIPFLNVVLSGVYLNVCSQERGL